MKKDEKEQSKEEDKEKEETEDLWAHLEYIDLPRKLII